MRYLRRDNLAQFGPANYVTLARAILVVVVATSIGRAPKTSLPWFVIGLITLIAILDGVDGWVARRTGTASAFGARFDMETDAALILVLSILVWQHGKAGVWVLLCGLMRYLFVAAGRLLPWIAQPLRSTRRGKTVAVGQLLGLSVALAPIVPVPISAVVSAVTLAALAWSFAVDIRWLSRHYRTT
jgi:phosphatidylglycerophosphate synthase